MIRDSVLNKNTDEAELFHLIQKGNRQAFTIIYEKYHKMLYVLAYRYLKDMSKAEDAVQHAFIKLWELHADITISVSVKNYLYTMTKNFILNQIRNETIALEHNYKIVQDAGEYEDNLFENIEKKELTNIFNHALECLPDQKRIVCIHKMEENLSNEEIAEKMHISIHTVKTHYSQAIKLLRSYMEKMLI